MSKQNSHTLIARVVVTDGEKLLVLRRSDENDRAGYWEVPGGHVEDKEKLEDAAKREVLEETGLKLDNLEFIRTDAYEFLGEERLSGLFKATAPQESVVKLSTEHDEFRWISQTEIDELQLDEYYQRFLHEWLENSEGNTIDELPTTDAVHHIVIYTDGGSRGNPGPSATGYVIMTTKKEILEEGGEYLGITTNNQAEYQAVKQALEEAKKYNANNVEFFLDSLLVVNQLNGDWKIKNKDLWPVHEAIKKLSESFEKITFTHVRREHNTLADEQVNKVLDSHQD